jgi:hypothetical protein
MYLPYFFRLSLSESCLPIQAAIAVGTSYDVLVDLFECVSNFLGRLRIHSEIPPTPAMSDMLVKIMMEVLSVLALATKQIRQGRLSTLLFGHISTSLMAKLCAEKFAKKLLGEGETEAVLQRLDRLTHDEARMTVAQTLQVVRGLVNNMGVVMNGMQSLLARCQLLTRLV